MRIDGVLFDRRSKCDCAVLFGREMDFIEFKTNAGNKTEVSMDAQYSKSYSQLLLSVKEFDKRYDGMDASFRDRFEVIQFQINRDTYILEKLEQISFDGFTDTDRAKIAERKVLYG